MTKRKGYAIVQLTIQREVEIELGDENDHEDCNEIVETAVEAKYGKLGENDEIDIVEMDYSDNRRK